jgi:hypothetical protein
MLETWGQIEMAGRYVNDSHKLKMKRWRQKAIIRNKWPFNIREAKILR